MITAREMKNIFILFFLFSLSLLHQAEAQKLLSPVRSFDPKEALISTGLSRSYFIKKNSSVHQSLTEIGLSSKIIYKIIEEARSRINLRFVQPGTRFTIFKKWDGSFHRIFFAIDSLNRLEITRSNDHQWSTELKEIETTKEIVHFVGFVENNLWNSAMRQKIPPNVIIQFAEVFGWQVDFSRGVQKGDRWRFSVEKLFAQGDFIGWGRIIYGEYRNRKKTHKGYLYENKNLQGYFDEKGQSLIKVFLKSPIKFGQITSNFSHRRYHPIHRRYKAHKGVDYGAPWGTPIRSVGDGVIIKIGRYGGSGKMIVIDHLAGYQTKYLHMSRFKKGLRLNSKVLQSQTIGYVGSTGLATGPHLHFEMLKYGRNINPLKVRNLPSSNSIPKEIMADFQKRIGSINRNIASEFKEEAKREFKQDRKNL